MCSPRASENSFAIADYNALEQKLNQFTSKSCSEPVSISSNTTVTTEVGKDKYKFLKVEMITIGKKMLVRVTLSDGNVKLFYSFKNRNPKDPADFFDYESEMSDIHTSRWTQFKSYFHRLSTKPNPVEKGEQTLVIEKPDVKAEFAYISIKGSEENNKFEVKFDDCDNVNGITSNASIMKLNVILMIISALLML